MFSSSKCPAFLVCHPRSSPHCRLLAPFPVRKHILKYEGSLDRLCFASIPIDRPYFSVYGSRLSVNRVTAFGAYIKRWGHLGGSGAAFRVDIGTVSVEMTFTKCTGELFYVSRLSIVMFIYAGLCHVALVTHSFDYVTLLHPFDRCHLLISFDC